MPSERVSIRLVEREASRTKQRSAAVVASMLAAAASPGCWSGHQGSPERLAAPRTTIPVAVWPEREITCLDKLLAETPDKVYPYRLAPGFDGASLAPADRAEIRKPSATVTDKGIFGYGLVRMYEAGDPKITLAETAAHGFTPNGRVLTSRGWNDEDAVHGRERAALIRDLFNERAATTSGVLLTGDADTSGIWAGVPIRIPPAVKGVTPTGVILHYHSIAANPHETAVLAEFASRGWLVVDVSTFAVVRAPTRVGSDEDLLSNELAAMEMERRLIDEVDPLPLKTYRQRRADHPAAERLRQLHREEYELRKMTFQVHAGADLVEIGRQVATQVDQQLAGNAYVGEAVVEYLYDRRPELKDVPLAIIGFSGGALASPALVARLGDRVDALILVGGGADLFTLTQESVLTDGGITIRNGKGRLNSQTLRAVHDSYLEHVKLDPWKIAPDLGGLPVLNVYGSWDRMVPTSAARRLTQRLGNPDRMVLRAGGHLLLFYLAPGKAEYMANWLDRAVLETGNTPKLAGE